MSDVAAKFDKGKTRYDLIPPEPLEELGKVCERHGHKLSELPTLVKRPRSTLVKLIDEYLWVTITNKCKAPTNQVLEQWMEWTNWS